MVTHLYYSRDTSYLADCWIRQHAGEKDIILVCEADALEQAKSRFSNFSAVSVADAAPGDDASIILPIAFDTVLMRYQYRVNVPVLPPHYKLFAQLWQCGFRKFKTCSPQGTRTYHIPHLLDTFKDKHKGQRCFIVGNGPSLNELDMTLLKDEITFGANRCYLGYEKWGFNFTYWGLYDQYQVEMHHAEYEEHVPAETVKFFPFEYLPLVNFENACPVNVVRSRHASHDFLPNAGGIHVGHTVSYMLLQIAALMGCNPIYLIGMDHRYDLKHQPLSDACRRIRRWGVRQVRDTVVYDSAFALHQAWLRHKPPQAWQGNRKLWGESDAKQPTHFDARYTSGGKKKFAPPEPAAAERDFACAKKWAKDNQVDILNATPGTALEVFEKVKFGEII
jgi:hypothetical protein